MRSTVWRFLVIAFGWPIAVAVFIAALRIPLGSPLGTVIIALLYMPAPAVAALLVERRLVRARLALPDWRDGRAISTFFLLPIGAVFALAGLFLLVTAIFGNGFGVGPVGRVVTSMAAFRANLDAVYGADLAGQARLPDSLALLFAFALLSAIGAGWSINGLFALGEEYGWRGLLWEAWRPYGVVRANLAIGLVWGLWHAPLIVQGFNYPGHRFGGIVLMIGFTTALSFVLTAIRELTNSVLPVAAAHGAINAAASVVTLAVAAANPLVGGLLGALGSLTIGLVASVLWSIARRRHRVTPASPPARPHIRAEAARL